MKRKLLSLTLALCLSLSLSLLPAAVPSPTKLMVDGTRMIVWSKTGKGSQRFQFEPGSEAGQYYVKSFGGLYFKLNENKEFQLTSNKAEAVPVYFYPTLEWE